MSLLTDHSDAQVVYIQYSVTLISITFLFVTIDCYQCLMILIVAVCMGFNMILKFILSLFYVLHLNTSLRLAYYKHVEKTLPPYGLKPTDCLKLCTYSHGTLVLAYLGNYSPTFDVAV